MNRRKKAHFDALCDSDKTIKKDDSTDNDSGTDSLCSDGTRTVRDLTHYLKEEPSEAFKLCSKSRLPSPYVFDPSKIVAPPNAYNGMRIPKERTFASDEYCDFTDYLATIEYDSRLLKFTSDNYKPDMRRSISLPNLLKERHAYVHYGRAVVTEAEACTTILPVDFYDLVQAEQNGWRSGRWSSPAARKSCSQISSGSTANREPDWNPFRVGWLDVEVTAVHGPDRFYIHPKDEPFSAAEFDKQFREWYSVDANKATLRPQTVGNVIVWSEEKKMFYRGVGVCFDKIADTFNVYCCDTGQLEVVRGIAHVRSMPPLFTAHPSAAIPVRMSRKMTPEQWTSYIEKVRRDGRIYVTAIEDNVLVASTTRSPPPGTVESLYCSSYYCTGKCSHDEYGAERREKRAQAEKEKKKI